MRYNILLFLLLLGFSAQAQSQFVFTGCDITPGINGSYARSFTVVNRQLYFEADTGIWVSDGSAAGIRYLYDRPPGLYYSIELIPFNGKIYFQSRDTAHGLELWATDGTTGGTQLVADISPGKPDGRPAGFIEYNGRLYFCATDLHGNELWVSDGAGGNTVMLKDIDTTHNNSSNSNATPFTIYNSKLYLFANDGINGTELWVCDGTPQGTHMVKDINRVSIFNSYPQGLGQLNGKMLFIATDGNNGHELFCSDGTEAGTMMLKDINPGAGRGVISNTHTIFKGKMYFIADDGTNGPELWVTDGTSAGTAMVKDINPGTAGSSPSGFCEFKGKLYFNALTATGGNEVWMSDGTAAGTVLLKDINTGIGGSNPKFFTPYKDHLFFCAEAVSGNRQMYISDGSDTGTHIIAPPGATKTNPILTYSGNWFVVFDSSLYFTANYDSIGAELWKITDTTTSPSTNHITKLNCKTNFNIYPNPNNGNFTIKINECIANRSELMVYDITGKAVHQQTISNSTTQLDLRHLPKGIYEVKLYADGEVASAKLQKE